MEILISPQTCIVFMHIVLLRFSDHKKTIRHQNKKTVCVTELNFSMALRAQDLLGTKYNIYTEEVSITYL